MINLIKTWANSLEREEDMNEDHLWIWKEIINSIPQQNLEHTKVLDIGCNQGGFLRTLYDAKPFHQGVGVDIATHSVSIAQQRKENRPIEYIATPKITDAGTGFDFAFSHEVIYLIEDLEDHIKQVSSVLKPGGRYYAITCCHSDNPSWPSIREEASKISNIPVPNHSMADILKAFRTVKGSVACARFLANTFIPMNATESYFSDDLKKLDMYTKWKLSFLFEKTS